MNKERLLNVAKALRESQDPEHFAMTDYVSECGSPMCALGHYAARGDLQDDFVLGALWVHPKASPKLVAHYDSEAICQHFEIDHISARILFGGYGCDRAKTPNSAAEYIERFVATDGEP